MSTDIELVRHSLNSFFSSMITTLKASGTSDEARQARLLESVHKHAMELPGIGTPGFLKDDEPDSDVNDFLERHVWRKDSTACAVEGCPALEFDPGFADHEDPLRPPVFPPTPTSGTAFGTTEHSHPSSTAPAPGRNDTRSTSCPRWTRTSPTSNSAG